jgi:hypothetical protein
MYKTTICFSITTPLVSVIHESEVVSTNRSIIKHSNAYALTGTCLFGPSLISAVSKSVDEASSRSLALSRAVPLIPGMPT